MNFLQMFGLGATKVEVKPAPMTPEQSELNEKIKAFFHDDAERVADIYCDWISPDVLSEIAAYHNYLDPVWGSRKFGRIMNSFIGMLDIERHHERTELSGFKHLAELGFWASLLYMIPIKKLYRDPGCEDQLLKDFAGWMMRSGRLCEDDIVKVLDLVFSLAESVPGDLLSDCFFDAISVENTVFGAKLIESQMRTHQGRNNAYTTYLIKGIANNRQPEWVILLQQKLGVTGFAESSVELLNESHDGF